MYTVCGRALLPFFPLPSNFAQHEEKELNSHSLCAMNRLLFLLRKTKAHSNIVLSLEHHQIAIFCTLTWDKTPPNTVGQTSELSIPNQKEDPLVVTAEKCSLWEKWEGKWVI